MSGMSHAPGFAFALLLAALVSAAQAREYVYPAIDGTQVPDRSQTPLVIEGDRVYQAIPGTRTPARSGPSWVREDDQIRPTIPGTGVPDRSAPGWRIERR